MNYDDGSTVLGDAGEDVTDFPDLCHECVRIVCLYWKLSWASNYSTRKLRRRVGTEPTSMTAGRWAEGGLEKKRFPPPPMRSAAVSERAARSNTDEIGMSTISDALSESTLNPVQNNGDG